jgi:hypothetical protein
VRWSNGEKDLLRACLKAFFNRNLSLYKAVIDFRKNIAPYRSYNSIYGMAVKLRKEV